MALANEVRMLLTGIASDQLIDVYERFINFLSEKEIFTSFYYILELISTREQYHSSELTLRLNDILSGQVDAILEEFDIELSDEITVPESLSFLEAFFSIEHWEDQDRLKALINNAESTEIALADIISEISSMSSDSILTWLKSVSPKFIHNISELTKRHDDISSLELIPDNHAHYEKVKTKVISYLEEKKDVLNINDFMSKKGIRLLTPFKMILVSYIENKYLDVTVFNTMENPLIIGKKLISTISDNVIGLGLMSGERADVINTVCANVFTQLAMPERVVTELLSQIKEKSTKVSYNG